MADDSTLNIKKYGEFLYDNIVVFAPTVEEFGGSLSAEALTEFIDAGGNLLIAGNSHLGEVLRELASEVGFEAQGVTYNPFTAAHFFQYSFVSYSFIVKLY